MGSVEGMAGGFWELAERGSWESEERLQNNEREGDGMNVTVGTCSLCGGRVVLPREWMGMTPAVPTCKSCGAVKKQPWGETIEMERPRRDYEWKPEVGCKCVKTP